MTMVRATWERPHGPAVDLLPDGRVLVDGDHLWTVDRAGRVVDTGQDPVALLEEGGGVWGPEHRRLGGVGPTSAAPPNSGYAWLTMGPQGEVLRYASDGEAISAGVWRGCEGPAQQTCMLISHLLTLREGGAPGAPGGGGVSVGIGVGVGVGIGIRR
jgi:hypothetical protein